MRCDLEIRCKDNKRVSNYFGLILKKCKKSEFFNENEQKCRFKVLRLCKIVLLLLVQEGRRGQGEAKRGKMSTNLERKTVV